VPQLTALLSGVRAPVECKAKFVSYFNPVSHKFLGNEAFIAASGYIGAASLKTSRPCGLPP
jgi:hypothetical protein